MQIIRLPPGNIGKTVQITDPSALKDLDHEKGIGYTSYVCIFAIIAVSFVGEPHMSRAHYMHESVNNSGVGRSGEEITARQKGPAAAVDTSQNEGERRLSHD